jgi:hypothetical protein
MVNQLQLSAFKVVPECYQQEEMKMNTLKTILAGAALCLVGISTAEAHDSISFGLNIGSYGYAPPPVVQYYPAPPVVYYPRPTYYYSPSYYSAPPVYYSPGATIVYRGGYRDHDDWDHDRHWGHGWGDRGWGNHGWHGHHDHDRD